jgi:hypothetical protein
LALICFSGRVSYFLPGPAIGHTSSTSASQVAGITGMHRHAQTALVAFNLLRKWACCQGSSEKSHTGQGKSLGRLFFRHHHFRVVRWVLQGGGGVVSWAPLKW